MKDNESKRNRGKELEREKGWTDMDVLDLYAMMLVVVGGLSYPVVVTPWKWASMRPGGQSRAWKWP